MLRLVALLATAAHVQALKCVTIGDDQQAWGDCSKQVPGEDGTTVSFASACYYNFGKEDGPDPEAPDAGCVPVVYVDAVDLAKPGCNGDKSVCWCLGDNCNAADKMEAYKKSYTPPPMCWVGTAGDNSGAYEKCEGTDLREEKEYHSPNCYSAMASDTCMENNDSGMGDGCPDDGHGEGKKRDQASCEAYQPEGRDPREADESFDGTTRHCRWVPAKTDTQKEDACTAVSGCEFHSAIVDCREDAASAAKAAAWQKQQGTGCEQRLKNGCFENNDWLGEGMGCPDLKDESACLAKDDGCQQGTCSGTLNATFAASESADKRQCAERSTSQAECQQNGCAEDGCTGCTWKAQCCKWVPPPADKGQTCAAGGGAGALAGLCKYEFSDGKGPPSAKLAAEAFARGFVTPDAEFTGKCALVATFVDGSGSAMSMNANKKNAVCASTKVWKSYAEHTGHDGESIDAYCANFLPEASAMAAIKEYSPGDIIAFAKQGQLGVIMPGLKDQLFIVTAKPEYGECLFTSAVGKYGAAICTCDTAGCNNQAALDLILDPATGPMRLLQFIDGSLSNLASAINAVVPGALNADGRVNTANAGSITEADVDKIMKVAGMSDKTSKAELWGIIQDFTSITASAAAHTAGVLKDVKLAAVKVSKGKVDAANTAAGCELYTTDGVPNTACLASLDAAAIAKVATATGIPVAAFVIGVAGAKDANTNSAGGGGTDPEKAEGEDGGATTTPAVGTTEAGNTAAGGATVNTTTTAASTTTAGNMTAGGNDPELAERGNGDVTTEAAGTTTAGNTAGGNGATLTRPAATAAVLLALAAAV